MNQGDVDRIEERSSTHMQVHKCTAEKYFHTLYSLQCRTDYASSSTVVITKYKGAFFIHLEKRHDARHLIWQALNAIAASY